MDSHADLQLARELLGNFSPRRQESRRWLARAAVALLLQQDAREGLRVLMIRRATRAGDPWSGHMAFPGGRREAQDADTLATAVRETHEEVGFDLDRGAERIGRLSDLLTRPEPSMVISPFVFALDAEPQFYCNEEVDELHWVPLDFLADRSNREHMRWRPNDVPIDLPCYHFAERRIWGLSLMMLDELLDVLY